MSWQLLRGDATAIPLADASVDLVATSPPYFALRSYTDSCQTCGGAPAKPDPTLTGPSAKSTLGGSKANRSGTGTDRTPDPDCPDCAGKGVGHYPGQIGSEATPQAFLAALWAVTAECVRVLKPSGSLWVNLGDKYAGSGRALGATGLDPLDGRSSTLNSKVKGLSQKREAVDAGGIPAKSLMGLPWRYAIGCIDQLGLILRAEVIWSKPNGLPESVTDRVRRSHEQWFHMTKEPRYFSAVDEVREDYETTPESWKAKQKKAGTESDRITGNTHGPTRALTAGEDGPEAQNPLGKLPGSVWTIPTEPLRVPDHLGVDHFAAFPSEWPRRIISGWSPSGVCVACGEGRRPVVAKERTPRPTCGPLRGGANRTQRDGNPGVADDGNNMTTATITGYACACPETTAPTTPAVILDPFCGTGTVPATAHHLGRHGIGIDLSADYLRLAEWRCRHDTALRAKVRGRTNREAQQTLNLDGAA